MGKLYLIPTPIGNLEDITLRAIRLMKEVDLLLAEDTRHTGKLLKHLEIEVPMMAFHQHNEHKVLNNLIQKLAAGTTAGLVTDAGTPGISDPGFLLVRACLDHNIPVETLPGATAFVPALVNSGFPSDRFCFEGFLPHKKGRQKRLDQLIDESRTMIFYESPYRLVKTLDQLGATLGEDRPACVVRELTKVYEETRRGSLSELKLHFEKQGVKGEIVIIVSGKGKPSASDKN